jgi:hypothetical protein
MLDLDQRDIIDLLGNRTEASFAAAKAIYTDGANTVGYTIQGFSVDNDVQMRVNGTGDYYKTFQKFVDYYGKFDYADQLITAGYDGTSVELNGLTFDFSNYETLDGRAGTCY